MENEKFETLKKLINEAEAVVIGAGSGLSTSAGFNYGGEKFLENFKWMNEKYGYTDMYSASFHDFETSEEKWKFWSKFIYLNRYKEGALPLYKNLLEIIKSKNYFVLTTNVDHQFQLAGFDKNRLFYTQGDYGLFQCPTPCHNKTYDNEIAIRKMIEADKKGESVESFAPKCPVCGKKMVPNLRIDETFVEDEGWKNASIRFNKFIHENKNKKILFLELGVGFNTPGIIKYPFMGMTYQFDDAFYAVLNPELQYIPEEIKNRSLVISDDINEVVSFLLTHED